jgi:hypothetical protein
VEELEGFSGREVVEIRGADFVQERVIVAAEEGELPVVAVAIGGGGTGSFGS